MGEVTVKFDDNTGLVKALEKRTALLERLLSEVSKRKGQEFTGAIKMITKSRSSDFKSFNKMATIFSGAARRIKAPKIIIPDNSSKILVAMNKRIDLLQGLLKEAAKTKKDVPVDKLVRAINRSGNKQSKTVENNTSVLLEAFNKNGVAPFPRNFSTGISVIPSPS